MTAEAEIETLTALGNYSGVLHIKPMGCPVVFQGKANLGRHSINITARAQKLSETQAFSLSKDAENTKCQHDMSPSPSRDNDIQTHWGVPGTTQSLPCTIPSLEMLS